MKPFNAIYLFAFISFLLGSAQFITIGTLDRIALSLGVPVASAGQLITVFSLASALGTPLVIMAAARWDVRRQLLLGLSLAAFGVVATAFLPSFGLLLVARGLMGIGMGVYTVCAYSAAAKLAPAGHGARALATIAIGASVSLVLAVPVGRLLTDIYDWRVVFLGVGVLTWLAVLAAARILPAATAEPPVSLGRQLAYLKHPRIAWTLAMPLFMFISYSSVNTYIAPLLIGALPFTSTEVSWVLLGLGAASVLGAKLGGSLADRWGAPRTLVGGMLLQGFTLVLVQAAAGTVAPALFLPLLLVWSAAAWTAGPTFSFNLVSLAPEAAGILLSLNGTFVQLGFALGAVAGGAAAAGGSILHVTWVGAAAAAVAVATAWVALYKAR